MPHSTRKHFYTCYVKNASIFFKITFYIGGDVTRATLVLIALTMLVGCKSSPPPTPNPEPFNTGEDLLTAMHDRYGGRWYRTITFVQSTLRTLPDGKQDTAIWYEAALFPSHLRIDFDPLTAGNGALYRGDSVYVMQRGNVVRRVADTNALLLLGFDVYFLNPSITVAWLNRLGYNNSKIRRDVWEGRDVYVVGANSPSDLRSRQYWVDRQNLVFVRLLEPTGRDSSQTMDIRFANYQKIGSAWVAPRVEAYRDGQLVQREDYRHIRVDVPLDTGLFNPDRWLTVPHWYQQRQ
jgi:hypothetical protein